MCVWGFPGACTGSNITIIWVVSSLQRWRDQANSKKREKWAKLFKTPFGLLSSFFQTSTFSFIAIRHLGIQIPCLLVLWHGYVFWLLTWGYCGFSVHGFVLICKQCMMLPWQWGETCSLGYLDKAMWMICMCLQFVSDHVNFYATVMLQLKAACMCIEIQIS